HNIHQFHTCGGSLNDTLACDEKVDALLNKAREVGDVAQRTALYREAMDHILARRNIVYLYFQNYIVAFPKNLKGYKAVPDDPIPVQYLRWVGLALRGDLGESIRTRQSVAWTVAIKVPITVELACLALLIALSLAIPAGVIAAVRRNTAWDVLASAVSLCGVS